MNKALQNAMSELKNAGAKELPSSSQVDEAKNGSSWSGKKSNGDPWELKKNSEDSYNCMC